MKFQQLIIHNITSIEHTKIDFEAAPLSDADVFLISGKTGAGKSTILDAICLALYSATPRLQGTKMEGDIKEGSEEISLRDPRHLMRRNTGEAYVSLTFIGNDGVHYEAKWSIARAYKKPTGNIQHSTWELNNLDTGNTLNAKKEVGAAIVAAIGLDFNQFCRTTMLAQGDFTLFLNSKDEEKAAILEKITGTDIYSKIGAKIYIIASEKNKAYEKENEKIEETTLLSEEQIKEKNDEISAIDKEVTNTGEQKEAEATKKRWIEDHSTFQKNVETATTAFTEAKNAIDSEDYKNAEVRIKQWDETSEARSCMNNAKKAKAENEKHISDLESIKDSFVELLGNHEYNLQNKQKMEDDLKDVNKFLTDEEGKAPIYENAQTILAALNTKISGNTQIKDWQGEIGKYQALLDKVLQPASEKVQRELQNKQNSIKGISIVVEAIQEELNKLDLAELQKTHTAANDQKNAIIIAIDRIETLKATKEKHLESETSLSTLLKSIESKVAESQQKEKPITAAEARLKTCEENLEAQKDSVDKFAQAMRARLHQGDICPLCGQKIEDELPHEDELQQLVSRLNDACKKAKEEYDKLITEKQQLDAEISALRRQYDANLELFNNDKSVEIAEKNAKEACNVCGIETIDGQTASKLEDLKKSTETTIDQLTKQIETGNELDKQLKDARNKMQDQQKELDGIKKQEEEANKKVSDCQNRIETTKQLIAHKEEDIKKAEQEISAIVTSGTWSNNWKEHPAEFAEELKTAAQKYTQTCQQKQRIENEKNSLQEKINAASNLISSIQRQMPEWKEVQATTLVKDDNLLQKANAIDNRVTTLKTQIKAAQEQYETNSKSLTQFLEANADMSVERLEELDKNTSADIQNLRDKNATIREQHASSKTLLESERKKLDEHQTNKPQMASDDTLESISDRIKGLDENLRRLNERKGAIDKELETNQETIKKYNALVETRNKLKEEKDKWERLNTMLGDKEGKKFRKIAQSFVLSSLIRSANSYMKTLMDRYTLKVDPGTFVILLEDAYQGYATRTTSTISGGESFLISLSLALALSDIGQRLSVDTLFIDEGFGSLSGEPLNDAINTLRALHSQSGRHVGIISHVEELKDRIPVQIQVQQENNSSSSSVRVVP